MSTRQYAVAAALVLLAVTSGCLGVVTGEEPLTFEADPAATDADVAAQAGYESEGTNAQVVNESVSVAGQTREVEVTTHVTTYRKSFSVPIVGEATLGTFSVVSTPAIEVAGKSFNPIADHDNDQLVEMVTDGYEGVDSSHRVDSRTLTVLGTETNVSKYAGEATFGGQSVDVYIHVTKVHHEGDYVVAVAVYPQQFEGESENAFEMLRAVGHPLSA